MTCHKQRNDKHSFFLSNSLQYNTYDSMTCLNNHNDKQERSVHVNYVSRVSPANTLKNKENSILSYFRGLVLLHYTGIDRTKCLQPARRCKTAN